MLMERFKPWKNGSAADWHEIGESYGCLFWIYVPEIESVAFKFNHGPGIPYPVMMVMIRRLDAGKFLAVRRPQGMDESASPVGSIDTGRGINGFEKILKQFLFSGLDKQGSVPCRCFHGNGKLRFFSPEFIAYFFIFLIPRCDHPCHLSRVTRFDLKGDKRPSSVSCLIQSKQSVRKIGDFVEIDAHRDFHAWRRPGKIYFEWCYLLCMTA